MPVWSAQPRSFDITSGVDLQEVDNAVNQARKEIAQRYDFKGSRAAIDLNRTENTLTLTADDEFKMTALLGDPPGAAWFGAACRPRT